MRAMSRREKVALVLELALLAAALAVAATLSRAADWSPIGLVAALLLFGLLSDLRKVHTNGLRISGLFPALVLSMTLLGPAPAVAISLVFATVDIVRERTPLTRAINNLAALAVFPLVGAVPFAALVADTGAQPNSASYALPVVAVYLATNLVNFLLIAGHHVLVSRNSLRDMFDRMYLPLLPYELCMSLFTAGLVIFYASAGLVALALFAVTLVVFQHLVGELLASRERADELAKRTMALAALQMGVLVAMLRTLTLRDKMTARHSAAVSRYASELATAAGCTPEEIDLAHTAGLLHDIGKFIFPDSILSGSHKLTDEEWEIVKRHPEQGAKVVKEIDGYGPVADIILCHHERIDGKGYPRGLVGEEIPRISRMISIADTYDTMTARDSYRSPVSPEEAIAELRRVAGAQLDAELVEVFLGVLRSKGVSFQHADDADFEAELGFERRVGEHAEPRFAA